MMEYGLDVLCSRTSASRMTAYPYDVDFPPAPELNVGDIEVKSFIF
jgi:hypothetical protein